MNLNTPWGVAESVTPVATGIDAVSTPSHGGYRLNSARWADLLRIAPDFTPFGGNVGWLEEDCDWAVLYFMCPSLFPAGAEEHARNTAEFMAARHPAWKAFLS